MTTETQTTETTETIDQPAAKVLSAEQEINALRAVHQFFSNFDRVPGFLSSQWSQALDTVAIVANSLIAKNGGASTEVATDTSQSEEVAQ